MSSKENFLEKNKNQIGKFATGIFVAIAIFVTITVATAVSFFFILTKANNKLHVGDVNELPKTTEGPSEEDTNKRIEKEMKDDDRRMEIRRAGETDPKKYIITEIADTPEKRAYGLMNRKSLDKDKGMLFIFDSSNYLTFWMKDTYIPLDTVFLDENYKIIKIHKNATPLDETNLIFSEKKSMYVIEINAGISDELNYTEGDILKFSKKNF